MKQTALIIVDMVRDFTDPEGLVYYPQNREILPVIRRVLDACRAHDCPIIFMQHCNRKDKPDRRIASMRPNCIEGTWGIEIDPMLPVDEKKDYVIRKRRYSGFFGTDLDLVLRQLDVKNVIIVGTKTNCCIRATVTDASYPPQRRAQPTVSSARAGVLFSRLRWTRTNCRVPFRAMRQANSAAASLDR